MKTKTREMVLTVDEGVERLFCKLAHQSVRGEEVEPMYCPSLDMGYCQMTGGVYRCLFDEPGDRQWAVILASELRRREWEAGGAGG